MVIINYCNGKGVVGWVGGVGWVTIKIIMPLFGPTIGKTLGFANMA